MPAKKKSKPAVKSPAKPPKVEKAALVRLDPLQRYFSQISQHRLLTAEEEHALALRYTQTKDPQAAYELTMKNLRLVVKIAMEYRKAWSNVLDLIQEGNIGLMAAIQRFDPYRQTRLTTYAAWWIRAYILKFIMSNWRLIKIGNTQAERKLFYNLRREQEKLLAEGFTPEPKLLAQRLNVRESDVVEMSKRLGGGEVSIDQPQMYHSAEGQEGRSLGETLANSEETMDDALADREIKDIVRQATDEFRKTLQPRELILLDRRLLAEEPVTLQEIGDELGISRERVRQVEERLMKKLREFIAQKHPDLKIEY